MDTTTKQHIIDNIPNKLNDQSLILYQDYAHLHAGKNVLGKPVPNILDIIMLETQNLIIICIMDLDASDSQ